jgi:hypothetical protein
MGGGSPFFFVSFRNNKSEQKQKRMARELKKDEQATVFAIHFVTPILAAFLIAAVADMFSLAHWTESVFSTMF